MISNGISLALAIGLQNIPEGTATAFSLLQANYSKKTKLLLDIINRTSRTVRRFVRSFISCSDGTTFTFFFLSFAAGAMLYVISDEIIPETHSHGNEEIATFSLIIGFY